MTTVKALDELEGHPHANVFPGDEPKTIRLELDAGESVPAHTHPDREIVFYLRDGIVEIEIGAETHRLSAGDIARFDGEQDIAAHAEVDSTALIVLAERVPE